MSDPALLIEEAFASSHTAKLVLPFCGEDGTTSIKEWALKAYRKFHKDQKPMANGNLPDDLTVARRAVRTSVHRWFDSKQDYMPPEVFTGMLLLGAKEHAEIEGEDFKEKVKEGLRAADARRKELSSTPVVLTEEQSQLKAIFSQKK